MDSREKCGFFVLLCEEGRGGSLQHSVHYETPGKKRACHGKSSLQTPKATQYLLKLEI